MKITRILIAAVVVLIGFTFRAEGVESSATLVVRLADNSAQSFAVSDNPVITYSNNGTKMKITSDAFEASYDVKRVELLSFVGNMGTTSVEGLDAECISFEYNGGDLLRVAGTNQCNIYGLNGMLLLQSEGGDVDLSSLAPGIYVVKLGNETTSKITTIKIYKR